MNEGKNKWMNEWMNEKNRNVLKREDVKVVGNRVEWVERKSKLEE